MRRQGEEAEGMPLAGACCSDPVYVVMAPVADVSVISTDPSCVRPPLLIFAMKAPVTPSWLVEE